MNNKEFTEKLAKRLVYIWHLRETDPRRYLEQKLNYEKEDIYSIRYDNKISPVELARHYYNNPDYLKIVEEGERYKYNIHTNTILEFAK